MRTGILLAAAAVGIVAVSGCGNDTAKPASEPEHSHVQEDVAVAHEVDGPNEMLSLPELADASELVVVGRVIDIPEEITIGEDKTLGHTLFEVEVEKSIKGQAPTSVRVSMATSDSGKRLVMPGRPVPKAGDRGIWFINPVDPRFEVDAYVLTSTAGSLLLEGPDGRLAIDGDSPALTQARELGTIEKVSQLLAK